MDQPVTRLDNELDLERFRLRRFVETLQDGDIEIHDEAVDLGDVGRMLDGNRKAVWLRAIGPERSELVGNVIGTRERLALALDTTAEAVTGEVMRRLKNTPQFIEIDRDRAPVQQVVETGDDINLMNYPVHLQHGLDGGLYISSALDVSVDAGTGLSNTGIRRLMLRNARETGIGLTAPSDLRAIYEKSARKGEHLPVSFVIGSHPIDSLASQFRIPSDELGLMASLRETPLPLVKCITNDLRVPADAEMVIEGYLNAAGHIEPEGPYGEFLGYYGIVKPNPTFHVTAITRRRDALFQTMTIAGRNMSATDSAQLMAVRTEVTVWQALANAVREPVAVHATASSGGMFNVRVALRQRVPGEARNAIAAVFGSLANVKHVFVVDPDIDVYSHDQMDWALATRFQADKDFVIQTGLRALPTDPSLEGSRIQAKAGFDCTMPLAPKRSIALTVPEYPRYEGARFASMEAALMHGPKTFEDLMAALGSRDGREIVQPLDEIRKQGKVKLNQDGRWAWAAAL
jgi:UbiD family decarboxylase